MHTNVIDESNWQLKVWICGILSKDNDNVKYSYCCHQNDLRSVPRGAFLI